MGSRIGQLVEARTIDHGEGIASFVVTGGIKRASGSTEHFGSLGGLDFAAPGKNPPSRHTMLDEGRVIRPVLKRLLGNRQPNRREIGPEHSLDPLGPRWSCLSTCRAVSVIDKPSIIG